MRWSSTGTIAPASLSGAPTFAPWNIRTTSFVQPPDHRHKATRGRFSSNIRRSKACPSARNGSTSSLWRRPRGCTLNEDESATLTVNKQRVSRVTIRINLSTRRSVGDSHICASNGPVYDSVLAGCSRIISTSFGPRSKFIASAISSVGSPRAAPKSRSASTARSSPDVHRGGEGTRCSSADIRASMLLSSVSIVAAILRFLSSFLGCMYGMYVRVLPIGTCARGIKLTLVPDICSGRAVYAATPLRPTLRRSV